MTPYLTPLACIGIALLMWWFGIRPLRAMLNESIALSDRGIKNTGDALKEWAKVIKERDEALTANKYLTAANDTLTAKLAHEKARDSARTAKGNRTRRLNRLAREAAAK